MFGKAQAPLISNTNVWHLLYKWLSKPTVALLSLGLMSFLLYCSILNNEFLSDDYDSLHRLLIEKKILTEGFLRPLIDISFLFNYHLSGLNPVSYYAFNILMHALNVWMIYCIVRRMGTTLQHPELAFLAAWFFLIYPFHNEAVVWLSGRLASIASLCALVAIYIYLGPRQKWLKCSLATVCFVIGLMAYESIILLPAILMVLNFKKANKDFFAEILFWIAIVVFYILARQYFSGTVHGDYGQRLIAGKGVIDYASRFGKTLGRMFLPPSDNIVLQVILFSLLVTLLFSFLIIKRRKLTIRFSLSDSFVRVALSLLISLVVPAFFGISTRTTEGDRLLYFPSVFLCLLLGYVVVKSLQGTLMWAIAGIVSVYFLIFLFKGTAQWNDASEVASDVMQRIKSAGCIVLINLPDEIEGAFVFRNGFKKSLEVHQIESQNVSLAHVLLRSEYLSAGPKIVPQQQGDTIFIHPGVFIVNQSGQITVSEHVGLKEPIKRESNCLVYFWDKKNLRRLF